MGSEALSKFPKVTVLTRGNLKILNRFAWTQAPCSYLLHKKMQMPPKNSLSFLYDRRELVFVLCLLNARHFPGALRKQTHNAGSKQNVIRASPSATGIGAEPISAGPTDLVFPLGTLFPPLLLSRFWGSEGQATSWPFWKWAPAGSHRVFPLHYSDFTR